MKRTVLLLFLYAVVFSNTIYAQSDPNISVIGDFRAFTGNYKDLDGQNIDKTNNLNYQLNSIELSLNGNLNPYTRADFYIASHGHEFELEEGYITFLRGLPLKMQVKAGKYMVDFGRLNTIHPHAYSFIDRPLIHRTLFGFDGFIDKGVNFSFLMPTDFYSKLSLNILAGDLFEQHGHGEHEGEQEGRNSKKPIYTGRMNFFLPMSENGNLDLGISGLYGLYQKHEDIDETVELFAQLAAIDLKYKHRWSDYSSVILQGEAVISRYGIEPDSPSDPDQIDTKGGWAAVEFQFRKRYNIGFKADYTPGIFDYTEENDYGSIPHEDENLTVLAKFDDINNTTAFTIFSGFMLMEETTLIRLAYTKTRFDIDPLISTDREDHYTLAVQVVWSLGPHKPHDF